MSSIKETKAQKKDRIRQRIRARIDEGNYEYIPEKKAPDYYDNDIFQRVGVYVRVSTDNIQQTSSYELQKKYYEEFVVRHPKWQLVGIYADEGISGTSLKHRDEFINMINDCKAGKIDLIITKSVSRFARNVVDALGMVRMLSERNPPIGVFFESENIFSRNENSQMALSFLATIAEEESRMKSRSMEASLRMRLDHGLPLTPKLLGFDHDEDGKLVINPETAVIPKLMFYMYLYGYTTQQIADVLTELGKKTYRGNAKWSAGTVVQVLHNERYCGDVYTRKTFTPDVLSHKQAKNRGERPRSYYRNEHEAIISRDDFIAVQHMLINSKYRNESILPELRVINQGLLKGYVIINPRWGAFSAADYMLASASAYGEEEVSVEPEEFKVKVAPGDFDFRGYEIASLDFFDMAHTPSVTFFGNAITFNSECVNRLKTDGLVELLVHPTERKFAVRQAIKGNRNAVNWCKTFSERKKPRIVSCAAFSETLYSLFGWDRRHKYRVYGTIFRSGTEEAYIFNAADAGIFVNADDVSTVSGFEDSEQIRPLNATGKWIGGVPASRSQSFGKEYYWEKSISELEKQTKEQWQLRIEGQLFNNGLQLQVTDYDILQQFIREQLGPHFSEEVNNSAD